MTVSEEQVAEAAEATTPSDDWRSALDPTIAGDPSIRHIGSVEAMAKSYINAQRMVGAEKIAVPGSWATEDDWAAVYNKLGRPESADGYELQLGDNADADFTGWFRSAAHSVGLSSTQAQKLAAAYGEYAGQAQQLSEQQLDARQAEIETALRKEHGGDFDARLAGAQEMLRDLDAAEFTEIALADGSLLGDNPQLIGMLIKVSEHIKSVTGEDTLAGRDSRPGLSAQDVQDRISELTQQGSPYWVKMHPDHARIVNQVNELYEQLHAE